MSHLVRLLVISLIGLIALFVLYHVDQWQGFAYLKAQREQLAGLFASEPATVAGLFFLLYVTSVALVLPWTAMLSIAAGAIFGLVYGTLLALSAATVGATLAFLTARYLLRNQVQRRFHARLLPVNEGIAREGGFYLFAMRLMAWLPFFLINPLMGLTPMRAQTFFWVTLIGMFPVTAVWVNAGAQLGRIESLDELISPGVLISLSIVGLLPLLGKYLVELLRGRIACEGRPTPCRMRRGEG